MTQRALLFGSVASAYERFRLGYPDPLVDAVLSYAERPIRTALEIGAGTGKATRAFAARGIAVTATDPDAEMLAELRRHLPDSVTTVQASLESLPPTAAYDLVFAAASLHWTDADTRWQRVAANLHPWGTFASFAGPHHLTDTLLADAVREARSPWLLDDEISSPDGTLPDRPMQWPGTELLRSDLFTDIRQSLLERRDLLTARDYVGYLSTVSAYLQLSAEVRREVLSRILDVLPDTVELTHDLTLHLARRV